MDLARHYVIRATSHRLINPFTEAKLALLGKAIGLRAGQSLLDLCSGKGELLCTWARDHATTGTGVDISTVFVTAARDRAVELGNNAGELVGFGIPSRNQGGPVVGFLGVLPVHRGRGYVDDILAEITADLAVIGAERIVADTDATNLPMAAAFERAGYHRFGVRLVASRPVP